MYFFLSSFHPSCFSCLGIYLASTLLISGYLLSKGFPTCIDGIAFATFSCRFYSLFNTLFLLTVFSLHPAKQELQIGIFFPTQGKIDLEDLASIPNISPPPLLYLDVPQNFYVSIVSFLACFHFCYQGSTLSIFQ